MKFALAFLATALLSTLAATVPAGNSSGIAEANFPKLAFANYIRKREIALTPAQDHVRKAVDEFMGTIQVFLHKTFDDEYYLSDKEYLQNALVELEEQTRQVATSGFNLNAHFRHIERLLASMEKAAWAIKYYGDSLEEGSNLVSQMIVLQAEILAMFNENGVFDERIYMFDELLESDRKYYEKLMERSTRDMSYNMREIFQAEAKIAKDLLSGNVNISGSENNDKGDNATQEPGISNRVSGDGRQQYCPS